MTEIGFKPNEPMLLCFDNQAAQEIANNMVQYDQNKHVEVDLHFMKEKLDIQLANLAYMGTEQQHML